MSPRAADAAALEVAARAAAVDDLAALRAEASLCIACPDLAATRTTVVFGDFPAQARLLVIGEAPGAHEDVAGRPFVGKAGQLLDRLLAEAGLVRDDVAVANVLKCRPPDNRMPTRAEVRRCGGWLDRQIDLVDPPLVLALGGTAVSWALGHGVRLGDVRGRLLDWGARRLVVSYHPSAAIRFGPKGAPLAALRADIQLVAEWLCS